MKIYKLPSWFPVGGIMLFGNVAVKDMNDQVLLAHEIQHVLQFRRQPWTFYLKYLFLLPFGWNPWRARWEAEAYSVQARAGVPADDLVNLLCGPYYGWCCRRAKAVELIKEYAR